MDSAEPTNTSNGAEPAAAAVASGVPETSAIPEGSDGAEPAKKPQPKVRSIGIPDLMDAVSKGIEDFEAKPSHYVFLGLIYPIVGLMIATVASGGSLLPLLYPMIAGFALVGPVAALAFYALSQRRENGQSVSWYSALSDIEPAAMRSIGILAAILVGIFLAWLATAETIYLLTVGRANPESASDFLYNVLFTAPGIKMLVIGNAVGFVFAAVVLTITVVSFPLLLDWPVDVLTAVKTSVLAVAENPLTMAVWGLIVAVSLFVGSLPAFVGLSVVLPVLGHATWHLYRKVVVVED